MSGVEIKVGYYSIRFISYVVNEVNIKEPIYLVNLNILVLFTLCLCLASQTTYSLLHMMLLAYISAKSGSF